MAVPPVAVKSASIKLESVSYLKRDHQLGLIQIDPNHQCGEAESKKMAVIFYASRNLKDCSRVHLSNQGVTVTYWDGSTEQLDRFIEVDEAWCDRLAKDNTVERLFGKDGCSKLAAATCAEDFSIFNASNYGIASVYDAEHLSSEGGIKLVQDKFNKAKFENIDHVGFMGTTSTPVFTSELVQLVRHLSTNMVQATDIITSALVCGNRLQPAASLSGDVAYCYIRYRNRYRLIPFNNSASSVKGDEGNGPIYSGVMEQVACPSPRQTLQEDVAGIGDLEKPEQTTEMGVQTDDSDYYSGDDGSDDCINNSNTKDLSEEDCINGTNHDFIDDNYDHDTFHKSEYLCNPKDADA
ncbi:hypothetical protein [Cardinium endosymbiont of Nabis limbatus]|uniref:hypothetical protein n=1 Tax=Cardinium endosymbiont of Nabis limbatus TaxID=3066217 RepID=UPI003AF370B4